VLAAVDEGTTIASVAAPFRVDWSYIYKALAHRRLTGGTTARPQRCHLPRKLAPYHAAIRAHVAVCRDATLDEFQECSRSLTRTKYTDADCRQQNT
jgi:hypothetical protein